jgi:hypothetical protein
VASFNDQLESWSAGWMLEAVSGPFFGVTVSLTYEQAIESWAIASRQHLIGDPEQPEDVLELVARERRLPRYFVETFEEHQDRLQEAWLAYELGGAREATESQLAKTGSRPDLLIEGWGAANPDILWGDEPDAVWGDRTAVIVFNRFASGPRGESPPYYSQYWIRFTAGHHPVTGPPLPFDGAEWTWGDTGPGIWAPLGYSPEYAAMWLAIVKKWRPNGWIFRGFIFDLGLELEWGEASPDLDWGDEADVVWGGAITVPMIT